MEAPRHSGKVPNREGQVRSGEAPSVMPVAWYTNLGTGYFVPAQSGTERLRMGQVDTEVDTESQGEELSCN